MAESAFVETSVSKSAAGNADSFLAGLDPDAAWTPTGDVLVVGCCNRLAESACMETAASKRAAGNADSFLAGLDPDAAWTPTGDVLVVGCCRRLAEFSLRAKPAASKRTAGNIAVQEGVTTDQEAEISQRLRGRVTTDQETKSFQRRLMTCCLDAPNRRGHLNRGQNRRGHLNRDQRSTTSLRIS